MRFKFILFLILFGKTTLGQLSPFRELIRDRQDITFDTSGKMISFPLTFNSSNTQVCFRVQTPRNIYQPWLQQLKQHLSATKKYLETDKVISAYDCLFKGNNEMNDYKALIDSVLALPDYCTEAQLRDTIGNNVDMWIPVLKLIGNVNRQYLVKVYKQNICIDSIWLAPPKDCGNFCDYFSSGYQKLNKDCKSCAATPTDQLRFELVHINPWNKTIRDWYNEKTQELTRRHSRSFNRFLIAFDSLGSPTVSPAEFNFAVDKIQLLRPWFKYWFWFNGGVLSLDPFKVVTENGKNSLTASIAVREKRVLNLKEKLQFMDSAKKELRKRASNLTDLEDIQDMQALLNRQIENINKEIADSAKILKGNGFLARIGSDTINYEGRLQPSKSFFATRNRSINPQKQFDAFQDYKPVKMSFFQQRKVKEIPENERMHIAIHNVSQAVKIKLDEKSLAFNDLEEFTALVSDLLSKIDLSSIPAANIGNLEAIAKSFGVPNLKNLSEAGAGEIPEHCWQRLKPYVSQFSGLMTKGYITFPPDPGLFDKISTVGPVYRTQLDPVTAFEAPFRDSINIKAVFSKDSTVDVGKTYVKVGKLRLIQLAMGIAVAEKPVAVTKIDTAGNGFKVSSSDNRAKAIFGFKLYPFRNYNRDHGLIPRYPLRRVSLTAAFEVLHPLDNFYFGLSYDIIPGLGFSYGKNLYLETRHRVENNQVINTSRSYKESGGYYSVMVNPVLFVQFVKLFFKSI